MQTNEEHVTMDGEVWELLERYEALFAASVSFLPCADTGVTALGSVGLS